MANKNSYQLYIHIDGEVGEGVGGIAKESRRDGGVGAVTAMTVYHNLQPFLSTAENILQNDVKTYVGSEQVSRKLGMAMSITNKALDVGVNVASGVSLASALGFGTGARALIGTAMTVVKEAMNILQRQIEINNKQFEEAESLSIVRGRAGVQYNRSRGGE